jgi:sigma-E factor negative regulatory protein RseC
VGERVEVEIEPARAVGAAFLMFILPLVAAVGGGIAGHRLGPLLGMPAAAAGIATGVLCLALAFVVLRRVERATRHRLPEIVRVIRDDQPEGGY